jgi:hypothetical protein
LALLLFSIARGEGYYRVHGDKGALPSDDIHSRLAEEAAVVMACRDAVARVVPAFVESARTGALPRPVWYATVGFALATGVTADLGDVLEHPPPRIPPIARAGIAVFRELVDVGAVSREAAHRAAVLDEDLGDYLDTDVNDLDPIPRDHYFVDLLVERMVAADFRST